VPEQVLAEVKRDPATGVTYPLTEHPLRQLSPAVSVLPLQGAELDLFFKIVAAPAIDALGDGEAAAIAMAHSRELDLVIDDKKARRILRERFSQIRTYWTVDMLRSRAVIAALGRSYAEECFARAKGLGRMHVPREGPQWLRDR
jgi:hypothetical protein